MIETKSGFDLPLVHHLMENCVLHFVPRVIPEVGAADPNLQCLAGFRVDAELTQPGLHSPREPEGDFRELTVKVEEVQPLVRSSKIMENSDIAGARSFAAFGAASGGRSVKVDREGEKGVLEGAPKPPGYPGTQKAHDGLEYPVRRHGISLVNSKYAIAQGEHDGSVVVSPERSHAVQPQGIQPLTEDGVGSTDKVEG